MNKLYIIRFVMFGKIESYRSYWNKSEAIDAMEKAISNGVGWQFELVENNDCHMIWEGR